MDEDQRSEALDMLATKLAEYFTDSTHPDNLLKRPVKTVCLNCEGTYLRRFSILVDPGYCNVRCKEQATRALHALVDALS